MGAGGGGGSRIPARPPPFLAGEVAGVDHVVTRTLLLAENRAGRAPVSGHGGARWLRPLERLLRRMGDAAGAISGTRRFCAGVPSRWEARVEWVWLGW